MILWIHFRPNHVISCLAGGGDHVAMMVSAFPACQFAVVYFIKGPIQIVIIISGVPQLHFDMSVNCLKAFIFFTAQIHTIIRATMVTMVAQNPMCNNNMAPYLEV